MILDTQAIIQLLLHGKRKQMYCVPGGGMDWRKLHNEELNDLYTSLNIVQVIKSRRMRWVGNVARTGDRRGLYGVLVGKLEGKGSLGRSR